MRTAAKRLKAGRRRGASAVEFALVLPLLITIVLGCVDFGRFAYTYIAVSNAAREGAYFAARKQWSYDTDGDVQGLPDGWKARLRRSVAEEMGDSFDPLKIAISFPNGASVAGPKPSDDPALRPWGLDPDSPGSRRVGIQVSYPFVTLVSWPLLPSSMTLARTVEMRVLY